jgi:hypothetical protein
MSKDALQVLDDFANLGFLDTDTLLAVAGDIGDSSLMKLQSGWVFTVEIPTVLAGAQFKVRSEFGHRSARDAILECIQRVKEALKK